MNFWDYLSIVCTIISVIRAYKSIAYYNKSKLLTMYASTNTAYIESQNIMATLDEVLKMANSQINSGKFRGKNYAGIMSQNGQTLMLQLIR